MPKFKFPSEKFHLSLMQNRKRKFKNCDRFVVNGDESKKRRERERKREREEKQFPFV